MVGGWAGGGACGAGAAGSSGRSHGVAVGHGSRGGSVREQVSIQTTSPTVATRDAPRATAAPRRPAPVSLATTSSEPDRDEAAASAPPPDAPLLRLRRFTPATPVVRRAPYQGRRRNRQAPYRKRVAMKATKRTKFGLTAARAFAAADRTLTAAQRSGGGFRPHAYQNRNQGFRSPSNPTTAGISSGYHEAALTTDTFDFLRNATPAGPGQSRLPSSAGSKPLKAVQNAVVDTRVRDVLLQAADGFRSDTAATILSAPGGQAAGHSGSGVAQSGQSAAHDLLRDACLRILQDPQSAQVSEQAITVALGAYVVGSIAPGEVARLVTTATLKAGADAIRTWEQRRNDAKERVESLFATLSDAEQDYVQRHSQAFLTAADGNGGRHLGQKVTKGGTRLKRATSMPRLVTNHGSEVSGGGYDEQAAWQPAATGPRNFASSSDTGLYVTQPFRLER